MNSIIEVTTTCNSLEAARQLADRLIAARLAACVQLFGPIESRYRWQGQIETGQEWTCTIKSSLSHRDRLVAFIQSNHAYQTPQILIAELVASQAYAAWVEESVSAAQPDQRSC